jgi:hypothetical protein
MKLEEIKTMAEAQELYVKGEITWISLVTVRERLIREKNETAQSRFNPMPDKKESISKLSVVHVDVEHVKQEAEFANMVDKTPILNPGIAKLKTVSLEPITYGLSQYNIEGNYCLVRLYVPKDQQDYFRAIAIINDKPVKLGATKEKVIENNLQGNWWFGVLVENHDSWGFMPKVLDNFKNIDKFLFEELDIIVTRATPEGLQAARERYRMKTKAKDYKYVSIYKRPEDPAKPITTIKTQEQMKKSPKTKKKDNSLVATQIPYKDKKTPSGASKPAKPVKSTPEDQNPLKSIETIKDLDKFIKGLPKGSKIVHKMSGKELKNYVQIPGKTKAEAVSFNDGEGKFRVCLISRFFTIKSPK